MAGHDIIVIGGSAGAFSAVSQIAQNLPHDINATFLVVIHLSNEVSSTFAASLGGKSGLPTSFAEDGEPVERGHIYVAPPDRHLLLNFDRIRLGHGAYENRARPAIDPLFRSAAVCCGPRVIGVLLSGYLDDGSAGLVAVKRGGGITVVQDPLDAEHSAMPRHAMRVAPIDHVATIMEMPALLTTLTGLPAMTTRRNALEDLALEVEIAAGQATLEAWEQLGDRSVLSCPECHGSLREIVEGDLVRYRCHTGHAFSIGSLKRSLDGDLTRALMSALRALHEKELVIKNLAKRSTGPTLVQWERRAEEYRRQSDTIRRALRELERNIPESEQDSVLF